MILCDVEAWLLAGHPAPVDPVPVGVPYFREPRGIAVHPPGDTIIFTAGQSVHELEVKTGIHLPRDELQAIL